MFKGAPRDAQDFIVVAGGVKPLLQDARLLAVQAALLAHERGGKCQVNSCRWFACNSDPTPMPCVAMVTAPLLCILSAALLASAPAARAARAASARCSGVR